MKRLFLVILFSLILTFPAFAIEIDDDANDAVDIANGGTNATSESAARTNLGLVIGTDVQAYDADTAKTDVAETVTAPWTFSSSTGLTLGVEDSANSSLSIHGSEGEVCGSVLFYNGGSNDTTVDYWKLTAAGTDFTFGPDTALTAFTFDNAGDLGLTTLTASGAVSAGSLTVESNTIDFGDVTEDYVLTFNASTNTWSGEAASGGGSGSLTTIKENNSQVGGSDIVTLDFLGADFDLAESPDTEIQVTIASAITRDAEIDTLAELETISNGGAYMSDILAATSESNFKAITNLEIGTDVLAPAGVGGALTITTTNFGTNFANDTDHDTIQELMDVIDDLSLGGSGDVTAASNFGTDNVLIKSDGTSKGTQATGISVDDSDNVSGVGTLSCGAITSSGGLTISKTSGVAGAAGWYEANSTDTDAVGFMGPASITESFYHQFPNTQPSGSIYAWGTPAGTDGPDSSKVSAATLYGLSGDDTTVITGTYGTSGYVAIWDADHNLIAGSGAPIVSGGNIGAATATTPAEDDNDTSVATTAYVQTEIAGLSGGSETNNLETVATGIASGEIPIGTDTDTITYGTDLPTATTIGSGYIYRAGGTDVADADVADNITITAGSQIANGSPNFTSLTSSYTIVTPQSLSVTTEDDVTVGTELTSSVVLLTGDNDSDDDTLTLQDGVTAGTILTFICVAGLDDTDDALIIDAETDSTCLGCPDSGIFTYETAGSQLTLYWTGSAWVYMGSVIGE